MGLFIAIVVMGFASCGLVHAQSASGLVITEVMTGSSNSASSEFVEIYNQSDSPVILTNIKIQYQASSQSPTNGSWTTKANLDGQLKARSFLLASSTVFDSEHTSAGDFLLTSGLSSTSGRIRIFDGSTALDSLTWGDGVQALEGTSITANLGGFSYKRIVNQDAQFVDDNNNSTDFVSSDAPFAQGGGVEEIEIDPVVDICPITPEIEATLPDGYEFDADGNCVAIVMPPVCQNEVIISEFLTDPIGLEGNGGEYIELYNPNAQSAPLFGCHIVSSKSSQDLYEFTSEDSVPGNGYYVINIVDKLTNGSGVLTFKSFGREDSVSYSGLHEADVMALFEGGWEITNKPTPMAQNEHASSDPGETSIKNNSASSLAACPVGKYRNPTTNRCRTLEIAVTSLAACDEDQYRNPLTNRCKSLSSGASTSSVCNVGQERNPETNRCRKVTSSSAQLKPCDAGEERSSETNRCRKMAAQLGSQSATIDEPTGSARMSVWAMLILGTISLGYVGYEYRNDVQLFFQQLLTKLGKRKPPG